MSSSFENDILEEGEENHEKETMSRDESLDYQEEKETERMDPVLVAHNTDDDTTKHAAMHTSHETNGKDSDDSKQRDTLSSFKVLPPLALGLDQTEQVLIQKPVAVPPATSLEDTKEVHDKPDEERTAVVSNKNDEEMKEKPSTEWAAMDDTRAGSRMTSHQNTGSNQNSSASTTTATAVTRTALSRPGSFAIFPSQGPNQPTEAIQRPPLLSSMRKQLGSDRNLPSDTSTPITTTHHDGTSSAVVALSDRSFTDRVLHTRIEQAPSSSGIHTVTDFAPVVDDDDETVVMVPAELADTLDRQERDRIKEQVRQQMAAEAVLAEPVTLECGHDTRHVSRVCVWTLIGFLVTIALVVIVVAIVLLPTSSNESQTSNIVQGNTSGAPLGDSNGDVVVVVPGNKENNGQEGGEAQVPPGNLVQILNIKVYFEFHTDKEQFESLPDMLSQADYDQLFNWTLAFWDETLSSYFAEKIPDATY